jgi:hypothetical protein
MARWGIIPVRTVLVYFSAIQYDSLTATILFEHPRYIYIYIFSRILSWICLGIFQQESRSSIQLNTVS